MPRIPESEIERLKQDVSLVDFIRSSGVELKRQNRNYVGLCPFHVDHEPSLIVTPSKNLWNCLGACKEGGDVFSWLMKREGINFRQAYQRLCEFDGPVSRPPQRKSTTESAPMTSARHQELLEMAIEDYHETLKRSPKALAYLEKRGIADEEILFSFKLGFADRTFTKRLPSRQRKEGAELRGELAEVGILRKETGHEVFTGSIVIPVRDENGIITEVYGRKINTNLRAGTQYHTYLDGHSWRGPHRGVWNPQGLVSKEVILCESLIDALTFWANGFKNVTASYGVNGFTQDHVEAFKRHDVKRVLIAYDRDKAGDEGARGVAARLAPLGIACYRVQFPKNMDANEYALKVTPATKSLELLLSSAAWMEEEGLSGQEEEGLGARGSGLENSFFSSRFTLAAIAQPREEDDLPNETKPLDPRSSILDPGIPVDRKGSDITIKLDNREYRVRGLEKNIQRMKVNLLVKRNDFFHVDILDLYAAKQRTAFINQAARELNCSEDAIRTDLPKLLRKLEELQYQQIEETAAKGPDQKIVVLSEEEQAEALRSLRNPNLLDQILADFETCGLIGEETNKLMGYLVAVSRKLPDPLGAMIQSSSSAGKTMTMEGILGFMPEEDVENFTAMTGRALFYMEETKLQHKIMAIAEEEGAEDATYPLKLLLSEKQLDIASTGKDPQTGKLKVERYRVRGPVSLILTTTAVDMDEELQNRCIVLTVDESREQTQAIHRFQREQETLDGWRTQLKRETIQKRHQNMQRLLKPIQVVNPYAKHLTFLDTKLRTRRDQKKYFALIRAIALLHQYQRPIKYEHHGANKIPYIEAALDDIQVANRLISETLGRCLDELTPQTRRFLDILSKMVKEAAKKEHISRSDYRFTRREIREYSGWSDPQVRTHTEKLVSLEYVLVHRGRRGQSFVYELLYNDEATDNRPFMMGLLDVVELMKKYGNHELDEKFEHGNREFDPSMTPQRPPIDPSLRIAKIPTTDITATASIKSSPKAPKKNHSAGIKKANQTVAQGLG